MEREILTAAWVLAGQHACPALGGVGLFAPAVLLCLLSASVELGAGLLALWAALGGFFPVVFAETKDAKKHMYYLNSREEPLA